LTVTIWGVYYLRGFFSVKKQCFKLAHSETETSQGLCFTADVALALSMPVELQ